MPYFSNEMRDLFSHFEGLFMSARSDMTEEIENPYRQRLLDTPPKGALMRCLGCRKRKAWSRFDRRTGGMLCKDCVTKLEA